MIKPAVPMERNIIIDVNSEDKEALLKIIFFKDLIAQASGINFEIICITLGAISSIEKNAPPSIPVSAINTAPTIVKLCCFFIKGTNSITIPIMAKMYSANIIASEKMLVTMLILRVYFPAINITATTIKPKTKVCSYF